MVKAAVAGRVKSRLARGIGEGRATWLYRHMSASVVRRLSLSPFYDLVLAVATERAVRSSAWPGNVARVTQGPGDLGERMQRIMERMPPGPVHIIGSDIPAVAPRHLRAAFRQLGRADVVLGPAGDGGYWLVGFRRSPRILKGFEGVRWSSAHALDDTIAGLGGVAVAFAVTLRDVDEVGDLEAWQRERTSLRFRFA